MSNIKDERLKDVLKYLALTNREQTLRQFNINEESLNRYLREARLRGMTDNRYISEEKKPNVLIMDIETAPVQAYVWRLWKQNVYIDQVESDWFMLSWSAKWLFDDQLFSDVLTPKEALEEDDLRITKTLWEFIDFADIIIGHNAERFDMPKFNTRCLLNGIQPPSPYQIVDTMKIAVKQFAFSSNKLDFIARSLGVSTKKDDGGFKTWKHCIHGDQEALLLMEDYNKQDIHVTEEVYLKLRPWVKSHPNMALYYDDMNTRCPNCGSMDLRYDTCKSYTTPLNQYSAVRCNNCKAVGRARTSSLTKEKRVSLVSSTAR